MSQATPLTGSRHVASEPPRGEHSRPHDRHGPPAWPQEPGSRRASPRRLTVCGSAAAGKGAPHEPAPGEEDLVESTAKVALTPRALSPGVSRTLS